MDGTVCNVCDGTEFSVTAGYYYCDNCGNRITVLQEIEDQNDGITPFDDAVQIRIKHRIKQAPKNEKGKSSLILTSQQAINSQFNFQLLSSRHMKRSIIFCTVWWTSWFAWAAKKSSCWRLCRCMQRICARTKLRSSVNVKRNCQKCRLNINWGLCLLIAASIQFVWTFSFAEMSKLFTICRQKNEEHHQQVRVHVRVDRFHYHRAKPNWHWQKLGFVA